MPTREALRPEDDVKALPTITEPGNAISTTDALKIDAHLAAPLRQALRTQVDLVEAGLGSELPETDDGMFVLSHNDLRSVISRSVIAGMGVTVHEVGSRISSSQQLEAHLALDVSD
jgi:hypothetical protein